MTDLLDQTLGNLACSVPGATRVFRQYRLDFCCGGDLSLREAAQRIEADPQHIADALLALEPDAEDRDWRSMPAGQLIEYILARFHERHRDQLPELIRLASRVEQVHGSKPGCPNGWPSTCGTCNRNWKATCSRKNRSSSRCCSVAWAFHRPRGRFR